ncbi:site-specific integrase [Stigmatella hybrida]|uniref:site-specific integrase n=1 Tax=Stigmatella hybrida TaxID=394097 RepID=UPI001CDA717F|nr:site-specific integrase [Stigmatella hybrida]
MGTKVWIGKWKGGRMFAGKDGRPVYVLRKMVHGRNYTIHLDARSETEAEAELALFVRDPTGYRTRGAAQKFKDASAVFMNAETVGRYLEHMRSKGTTERYVKNVGFYLAEWAGGLAGRDLRAVTLQDLLRKLNQYPTARKNRITAFKSFCAWLREEQGVLTVGEDTSLSLKVPASRPEKSVREKGYSIETIQRLYRAINGWEFTNLNREETRRRTDVQCVRDVLCIHAKTGMHGTEIERLARGEGKVSLVEEPGEIAATVKFIHKSGHVHLQSIDRQTLAAVQRLQARGAAPVDSHIRRVVRRACKTLKLFPVRFGELRHSFVTWASECGQEVRPKAGGIPLSAVAAVVGHHSAHTTKRFYDNAKVPPMIKIPIHLEHPEDPVLLPVRRAPLNTTESGSQRVKGEAERVAPRTLGVGVVAGGASRQPSGNDPGHGKPCGNKAVVEVALRPGAAARGLHPPLGPRGGNAARVRPQ